MTASPLRVMTFNIRGFYHPGDGVNQWRHRESLNVETIRRCSPDLIGMQEVQTGNMKAYHRLLPEYHWQAWPEYGNQKPHEWPAIYWRPERLQPLDSGGFWLSQTPERFSRSWETDCIRSAAWIRFYDRASDAMFVHLNTHLDHRSQWARYAGSRLIIERLKELQAGGEAAIVTGDFNDVPGSRVYGMWIDAGFTDAHTASGGSNDPYESYTNHGWRGYPFARNDDTPQRIDWIMVRGAAQTVSIESCAIVLDAAPPVYPSDHYPLVAEVRLST